ncbi:hypothetical protein ACOMHN_007816 [Nucella lapillus]
MGVRTAALWVQQTFSTQSRQQHCRCNKPSQHSPGNSTVGATNLLNTVPATALSVQQTFSTQSRQAGKRKQRQHLEQLPQPSLVALKGRRSKPDQS